MPTTPAVYLAATLLTSGLSTAAVAQTGHPSEAPADHARAGAAGSEEVGSYARYLMLNGKPRDQAVMAAWSIDHPAPSKHFALRGANPNADAASNSADASSAVPAR